MDTVPSDRYGGDDTATVSPIQSAREPRLDDGAATERGPHLAAVLLPGCDRSEACSPRFSGDCSAARVSPRVRRLHRRRGQGSRRGTNSWRGSTPGAARCWTRGVVRSDRAGSRSRSGRPRGRRQRTSNRATTQPTAPDRRLAPVPPIQSARESRLDDGAATERGPSPRHGAPAGHDRRRGMSPRSMGPGART